jgi:glutaredoxin
MDDDYIIYGRKGCPFTENALELAKEEKLKYTFIEVPKVPNDKMCEPFKVMAKENMHRTVPCIFRISFVGGFTEFRSYLEDDLGESQNEESSGGVSSSEEYLSE